MIGGRRVIAIIPARGGSKGILHKNIKPMCGKPLIVWTIEQALRSTCVDTVLVTTDDQAIADIATRAGAAVPFIRPDHLATDTAPTIDAIDHALAFLKEHQALSFDYVVLLEPTSPLREDDDIDQMVRRLHDKASSFDSIISVGEVSEHPSIMKKLVGDYIAPFCSELQQTSRRQDNEPAFFPYGVAYISKTSALLGTRTFYGERCTHYRIKRYQNYEIDDLHDFLAVEAVMRHEWKLA